TAPRRFHWMEYSERTLHHPCVLFAIRNWLPASSSSPLSRVESRFASLPRECASPAVRSGARQILFAGLPLTRQAACLPPPSHWPAVENSTRRPAPADSASSRFRRTPRRQSRFHVPSSGPRCI